MFPLGLDYLITPKGAGALLSYWLGSQALVPARSSLPIYPSAGFAQGTISNGFLFEVGFLDFTRFFDRGFAEAATTYSRLLYRLSYRGKWRK